MRVALVQIAAGPDKAANLDALVNRVRAAVDEPSGRPDLVVCPEASMYDFAALRAGSPQAVSEALDGPFVGALADLAREVRTTLVAGVFETPHDADAVLDPEAAQDPETPQDVEARNDLEAPRDPETPQDVAAVPSQAGGRAYNTTVALGPDGSLLGAYRKLHLYDAFGFRESDLLLPGPAPNVEPPDDLVVLPVADRTVGLLTCYDLRFPELTRALVDRGADVLVLGAAWVRGPLKEEQWTTLLRARAIENTSYVAAAAQSGSSYCGRSMLVDPMGVVVSALADQEGYCTGEVSGERIDAVRRTNPSLEHRRFSVVRRNPS